MDQGDDDHVLNNAHPCLCFCFIYVSKPNWMLLLVCLYQFRDLHGLYPGEQDPRRQDRYGGLPHGSDFNDF
jgi:hypothetical protein